MLLLEVERKFRRLAVDRLHLNSGHPPFHSLLYRGTQTFHDTYYDSADFLSTRGVWVRRRNNTWQAKIRRGGDYSNSKFEELSTTAAISAYLAELTGGARTDATNQFGLTPMASFTTLRESWTADDDFTIVQDVTDFGHTVGEWSWNCGGTAGMIVLGLRLNSAERRRWRRRMNGLRHLSGGITGQVDGLL